MGKLRSVLSLFVCLAALTLPAAAGASGELDSLFDGKAAPEKPASPLLDPARTQPPAVGELGGLDNRSWVTISADDSHQRGKLADLGMSIEEVRTGVVAGIVDPESLKKIEAAGFQVQSRRLLASFGPEDFPAQDSAYHNYAETVAELRSIAGSASDVATLFSLGKSIQGRDLLGVRFNKGSGAKPGILFMGDHHAREHLTVEVTLGLARYLADNRAHPAIKSLLEKRDIYFVPMVNPDGAEYDVETGRYRWHRKNMRQNADGSFGVDLNRNYGYTWSDVGSSDDPGDDTYHGPNAFSEPESRAVRDFIVSHPDVRIMVSYHSYGAMVLYPWGHIYDPVPDARAAAAFKTMAQRMGQMTGYEAMQSSELYPAAGDTCDWAWGERQVFCFTFELSGRGFYPGADEIGKALEANVEPAVYMIGLSDDPYRAASAAVASLPARRTSPIEPVR